MKKRIFLCLLLGLILLLLASCSSKMNTELAFDSSFSGTRTISCTISRNDAERSVNGGVDALDAFIRLNCPEVLRWKKSEDRSSLTYLFTLSFKSEEEYVQKAEILLGRRPKVLFAAPKAPFPSRFCISEDFSSSDLMGWFQTLALEKGLISQDTPFWKENSTRVFFEGKSFDTSAQVNIREINSTPPERISISTVLKEDQSYERMITYLFPSDAIRGKEAEYESYFKDRTPLGGDLKWAEVSSGRSVILSFSAEDTDDLFVKTAQALDSSRTEASLQTESDSPLSSHLFFRETLNFSAFLPADGTVPVDYSFRSELASDFSSAELLSGGVWSSAGELSGKEFHYSGEADLLELRLITRNLYKMENISIKTRQLSSGRFQREMLFTFEQTKDQAGPSLLSLYFEEKNPVFTQISSSKNNCVLTVTGSPEEITLALESLFGEGNSLAIENDYGFQLMQTVSVIDRIELSSFLRETELLGQTVLYSFHSLSPITDFCRMLPGKTDTEGLDKKGDEAFCALPAEGNASLRVQCGSVNYFFVFVLGGSVLLGFVLIATVMVWVLRLIRWQEKNRKEKKNASSPEKAREASVEKTAEETEEEKRKNKKEKKKEDKSEKEQGTKKEPEAPILQSEKRCPCCGAPLYGGMSFCINCGERVSPRGKQTEGKEERELCPYCGVPLCEEMPFCINCGEKVSSRGKETEGEDKRVPCPYCGTPLYEEMSFCISCGERVSPRGKETEDEKTSGKENA